MSLVGMEIAAPMQWTEQKELIKIPRLLAANDWKRYTEPTRLLKLSISRRN